MKLKTSKKKLKVATVIGTRPEIIKLSRVISKLDQYTDQCLVFTGQSFDYEMSDIFFEQLEVRKPDHILKVRSDTLGGQIANILKQTEKVFLKEKPDAVVVLGDTNSALCALMARRMKIMIFHMEAGNRSFDKNVPEEVNRKIIDHISEVNMAYTDHARRNLLREGIHPGSIFVTGSPLPEVLKYFEKEIEESDVLKKVSLEAEKYFLVSIHREENVDDPKKLKELVKSLNFVAREYRYPVVVSLHPRTKQRLGDGVRFNKLIRFGKPFGFFEYINLQKNALCVLSDSGTIPVESSILGFRAVQVRVSSERYEAMDKGCIVLSGLNRDSIVNAISLTLERHEQGEKVLVPEAYRDVNFSTKVVKIVLGWGGIKKYDHILPPRI